MASLISRELLIAPDGGPGEMSKLNVLYHHRTQGRGVEGVHILAVADGLQSRGHFVSILSPPGAHPVVETTQAKTPNTVWAMVSSGMPQFMFELLELVYNVVGGWRMLKYLRANTVDVLYERYALFLFVGVAVCGLKGIPVVLEVNDSAFVSRVRPVYSRRLARWVESWVFKKSDALITVTEAFKRILVSTGVDPSKVFVIHNAAQEEMFSPDISGKTVRQRYGLGDDTVVVGFVGKVVPWHGVDCLIQEAHTFEFTHDFWHHIFFVLVDVLNKLQLRRRWTND